MSAPIPADQVNVSSTLASPHTRMERGATDRLVPIDSIPVQDWSALAAHAIEPNACYLPDWALAVARHARGRGDALALAAFGDIDARRLVGLMPVRWADRALRLPVPLLVSWNAYAPYSAPLLDRDHAIDAAEHLIKAARQSGARALLLQTIPTEGPAWESLLTALQRRHLQAEPLRSFRRAGLDATQDPEVVLREALSGKKLKELRRQRNRLEDAGPVHFDVASAPDEVGIALEAFLALEAKGWKGERGTALIQHPGDAAFIRQAAGPLAARGHFQVASLNRNGKTLAAGLILRDGGRAFFFKIAMDETEARMSPGVQLTLDLTRYLCADPAISFADSTADGEHPMIDHIWRERIPIADVFVPLHPRDPYASAIRALIVARYRALDLARTLRRIKEKLR